MLDELLTERTGAEADTYGAPGYPDIPKLATRDQLVALHRDLAQLGSVVKTGVIATGARIVAELAEAIAHTVAHSVDAYNARNEAVQKAVEHVIAAVRYSGSEVYEANRELTAAQTWLVQARMATAG